MSQPKQFCTFYLGAALFGVEVTRVQEVIRYQEMTEVPLAPAVVRGLINLRGSIVSCIDLRRRFGMGPAPEGVLASNVVTQTAGGLVSLQVDRIGDVVEVTEESQEAPPDTLRGAARKLIGHVYKLNGSLLRSLNVEGVLDFESSTRGSSPQN